MRNRKIIGITLVISLLVVGAVFGIKINSMDSDIVNGIRISGGEKNIDWILKADDLLWILDDGITLSGTAEKDLKIVCRKNVSEMTIEDLQQADYRLKILSTSGESVSDKVVLNFKGENQLYQIAMLQSVTIKGNKNAVLTVSEKITSIRNLIISDSTINSGQYKTLKKLTVDDGTSNITARELPGQIY